MPEMAVGINILKYETPKLLYNNMVNDMVNALSGDKENLLSTDLLFSDNK